MQITRIEAIPFRIPFHRAVGFANGNVNAANNVLVRIHTDEGLVGQAEASPRPMTYGDSQASVVSAIRCWFEPMLVGLDPFAVERANQRMATIIGNNTAKAAIDLALHDIIGQALNQPCHRLLGAYDEQLRVAHILGFGAPEVVAHEAAEMAAIYGIRAFKIKIGLDGAADVATCRAVREAVPDALLYVDANHGYRAEEAVKRLREMADVGIAWVEEPSPAADPIGRQLVARALEIPITVDESAITLADVTRELSSGVARMVSVKTARTGFHESRQIVAVCRALGAEAVCGSQLESSLGSLATLAFGLSNAATAKWPAELTSHLAMTDDLLAEPLVIRGGVMRCVDRPGLGLVVEEEKLRRYRVDDLW